MTGKKWKSNYLIPLFLIPVAANFGNSLAPGEAILLGQGWGILASFSLAAVAICMWLFTSRNSHQWMGLQKVFLLLLGISWVYQTVSTYLDNQAYNYSAFLLPLTAVLLYLRKPTNNMIGQAFKWFLNGLVVIALMSLSLDFVNLYPSGFEAADSGLSRIPILDDLFEINARWAGPFASVNLAAPVGGLLVVAGFTTRGITRSVSISGGILILLLSQGRTSIFATLVGISIVAMYSNKFQALNHRTAIRASIVLILGLSLLTYIYFADRTLADRTYIWENFIQLFWTQPITGIGTSGLEEYIALGGESVNSILYSHGHNVMIDIATRYGVILLALTLGLFVTATLITWKPRGTNNGRPLAILAFVIFAGLAETIHDWQYLSIFTVAIIYAVIYPTNSNVKQASKNWTDKALHPQRAKITRA